MAKHAIRLKKSQSLSDIDPNKTPGFKGDEAQALAECDALRERLIELQTRLYAEQQQSLLVIFQAMDTAGKDGVIRRVFSGLNPQGVEVEAFKRPSETELAHDFLWRVHQLAPAAGQIALFNRSHYEDVLVVRVHEIVEKSVWRKRFGLINDFERLLAHRGTKVIKFYLHIDLDEQKERLQARLDDPTKCWKFEIGDLAERKLWPQYMKAYHDAITQTDTDEAPWYIVPANNKWYRDWCVLTTLVKTLEAMDPQFPKTQLDVASIKIT